MWAMPAIERSSWLVQAAALFDRLSLGDGRMLVGARWSNVMLREVQSGENLLYAFALMILSALGAGLGIALGIIWLCS
jgi:hypothetical protein